MAPSMHNAGRGTAEGRRFAFGQNWSRYLAVVDDARIELSKSSFIEFLGTDSLDGLSFLDVGSGSGLSSLAAISLGAARVHSFDYDPASVTATTEIKRRYAPHADHWSIERGSVLDATYMEGLGTFDFVYTWGVLHHTGDMRLAFRHVAERVAPGGRLWLAIYNDQGHRSEIWRRVKRIYNELPPFLRPLWVVLTMSPLEVKTFLYHLVRGRPQRYFTNELRGRDRSRGMSRWHDFVDWVGGYPFEVARPDAIVDTFRAFGLSEARLRLVDGYGCNEFLFTKAVLGAHGTPSSTAVTSPSADRPVIR